MAKKRLAFTVSVESSDDAPNPEVGQALPVTPKGIPPGARMGPEPPVRSFPMPNREETGVRVKDLSPKEKEVLSGKRLTGPPPGLSWWERRRWKAARRELDEAIERRRNGERPVLSWEQAKSIAERLQLSPGKVLAATTDARPAEPPSYADVHGRPIPARNVEKLKRVFHLTPGRAPDAHDLADQLNIRWYPAKAPMPAAMPKWQERWMDFKRLFTARGRNLRALKARLREQVVEAKVDLEWAITYNDERAQGEKMRQWFREEHEMIDDEILDQLQRVYPQLTDEERRERMRRWSQDVRRRYLFRTGSGGNGPEERIVNE